MLATNNIFGQADLPKYTPRSTAPLPNDKNYINTAYGGFNKCIVVNTKATTDGGSGAPIQVGAGSCLPNCTGYCWGRWRELLGCSHSLPTSDAQNWMRDIQNSITGKSIYKTGYFPKPGAVMVWGKGSKDYGHVAIVEQVLADGTIWLSQSNYPFPYPVWDSKKQQTVYVIPKGFEYTERKNSGTALKPYYKSNSGALPFLGFIYLPKEFSGYTEIKLPSSVDNSTDDTYNPDQIIGNIKGNTPVKWCNGTVTFEKGTYEATLGNTFDTKTKLSQSNANNNTSIIDNTIITYKVSIKPGILYYQSANIFNTTSAGMIYVGDEINIKSGTDKIVVDPKTNIKYTIAQIKKDNNYYYCKINNMSKNESYVTR